MINSAFRVAVNLTGINTDCLKSRLCIPRGLSRFGWPAGMTVVDEVGELHRLPEMTWPEDELPSMIMAASDAAEAGEEFVLYVGSNELVITVDQVSLFVEGLQAFISHQETCQNRGSSR